MLMKIPKLGIAFRPAGNPSLLLESAALAESVGFDSVWLVEVAEVDTLALAGAISQATQKIKIATGVVNSTLRLPTLLAMGAVTVSQLSRGRFILGVGAGSPQMRYAVENGQNTPLTRLGETLRVIRGCLSGKALDFDGALYKVSNFRIGLTSDYRIPLYAAAMGPKTIATAASDADGVILMFPTLDYLKTVMPIIDNALKPRGLSRSLNGSFGVACHLVTVISDDAEEAIRYAKITVANYAFNPAYHKHFQRLGFSSELDRIREAFESGSTEEAAKAVSTQMAEKTVIYGNTEECLDKISDLVAAGITEPVVYPSRYGPLPYPERINDSIKRLAPFLK